MSDPDETFLTVADVAGLLKLNQQTVRNWIDQGSLPSVRVGRRVRIKRSDFDRIVEQGYRRATSGVAATGPSAADFWSGHPVGAAELEPAGERDAELEPAGERDADLEPAGEPDPELGPGAAPGRVDALQASGSRGGDGGRG